MDPTDARTGCVMRMQARHLAFTTLVFAAFGSFTAAAYADAPASAPTFGSPNSNIGLTGPTVQGQELTAFSGRTPDPYFLPKGVPLGGPFRLFPNLQVGLSYDDNVFKAPGNSFVLLGTPPVPHRPPGDFFFTIAPTLVLDYDTSRARVDFYADAKFAEYLKLTTVNTTDFDLGLAGQYEISAAADVRGNASYSQLSEPLSSANTGGSIEPDAVQHLRRERPEPLPAEQARLHVRRQLRLVPVSEREASRRRHGRQQGPQQRRYTRICAGELRLLARLFGLPPCRVQQRLLPARCRTALGIFRSSHGYKVDAGLTLLLGDLIQGQIYLGYVNQLYNHHQTFTLPGDPFTPHTLKNVDGLDFGADLKWYPTELLTVELAAQRTLQNTTLAGASAGDDRGVRLGLQYELTRRIALTGRASYDDIRYDGTARPGAVPPTPTRDDNIFDVGVGGKWLISHYVSASMNYDYSSRSSTIPAAGFHDNTVMVGINLQI